MPRSLTGPAALFTTQPLPVPRTCIPLARAMLCLDCSALSVIDTLCMNCGSGQIMPLAMWMDRVRGMDNPTAVVIVLATWLFSALQKEEETP